MTDKEKIQELLELSIDDLRWLAELNDFDLSKYDHTSASIYNLARDLVKRGIGQQDFLDVLDFGKAEVEFKENV